VFVPKARMTQSWSSSDARDQSRLPEGKGKKRKRVRQGLITFTRGGPKPPTQKKWGRKESREGGQSAELGFFTGAVNTCGHVGRAPLKLFVRRPSRRMAVLKHLGGADPLSFSSS
jgi:hypothetical protein